MLLQFRYLLSVVIWMEVCHSLDSVGEDNEAHEDSYCSVQVPHLRLMLEHLGADEDGEAHDPAHQRVKS